MKKPVTKPTLVPFCKLPHDPSFALRASVVLLIRSIRSKLFNKKKQAYTLANSPVDYIEFLTKFHYLLLFFLLHVI